MWSRRETGVVIADVNRSQVAESEPVLAKKLLRTLYFELEKHSD
jgi:hypothetical protein